MYEKGIPYDLHIQALHADGTLDTIEFVEVKASAEEDPLFFRLSKNEWEKCTQEGSKHVELVIIRFIGIRVSYYQVYCSLISSIEIKYIK